MTDLIASPTTSTDETRATNVRSRLASADMRKFWRGAVPLFVALSLLNGSNYIFHVFVSRLLGPSKYGSLTALLAVLMVISVPVSVVQTIVAKRAALLRKDGKHDDIRDLAVGTLKSLNAVGLASFAALLVISPLLAAFLHAGTVASALIAPYAWCNLVSALPLGILQGTQRFGTLAWATFVSVGLRLAIGVGLVLAGLGVPGAMFGTVVAQGIGLLVALALLRIPRTAWRAGTWNIRIFRDDFGLAMHTLISFWLLAEIDLVLARHYLPQSTTGLYSSAGIAARVLLFLPAAIGLITLPRFAETKGRGREAARWVHVSLAFVGVLVAVALPVLILFRHLVMSVAFGRAYLPAAGLIPVLALAMGLLAGVNLLANFHIAAGTRAYRLTYAAVVAEVVGIAVFHHTPTQIALVVAAACGLTVLLQYQAARAAFAWSPGRPVDEEDDRLRLVPPTDVDISLVLPCHNAGSGLGNVLEGLSRELATAGSYEIIVVSDGCTDQTVPIAHRFADAGVRVIEQERGGKGSALRTGLVQARGHYIAFMDADGDIDPKGIRPFVTIMDLYRPDIVLGSKRHPLSDVHYPPLRRLMSWAYHKLTRILFRVNVRDTQTGMKMIRRDVLAAVLPRMLEKRFAFDLELLVVARSLGYTRVFEAPITLEYQFDSNVNAGATLAIVRDTAAIFYRRYVLDTYRGEPSDLVGATSRVAPEIAEAEIERRGRGLDILILNWRDVRNPEAGGAEMVTHEVAKRWVAQGHRVTLWTSRFRGAKPTEVIDGVRVRRQGRLRAGTLHLMVQRNLAKAGEFDLVIDEINTIPFFTPLYRDKLPPIMALIHQAAMEVWDAELPKPLASVGKRLEPKMLQPYRDVPTVTVSLSTKRDLLAMGLRHIFTVPNGRDEAPPMPEMEKESRPTFLFVGRLAENKRPNHAVEAFRAIKERLPEAQLWIVGQGPMERDLRKQLPQDAELLGFVSREELYRRMARAHCLLVPSVREGWGLVVIEANSVGTPVVGYDVAGIRDSVRHEQTGLLVEAGDPRAMADAALELVSDESRYQVMRRQAEEWARTFSWDAMANRLMDVIRDHVLAQPQPQAMPPASARPSVATTADERQRLAVERALA